jgi:hypothetical protein
VRLRLGIGGRAFGVRGGVSNTGFGVGVGPVSAGTSWRRRRRSRKSGGGWGVLILIALVVGGLSSLCSHPTQPHTAAPVPSVTYPMAPPAAQPGTSSMCPTQAPAGAPASITVPDVVGQNAQTASDQLRNVGLTHVELRSANPKYRTVIVASNWRVVGIEPASGCAVSPSDRVVVKVTKP